VTRPVSIMRILSEGLWPAKKGEEFLVGIRGNRDWGGSKRGRGGSWMVSISIQINVGKWYRKGGNDVSLRRTQGEREGTREKRGKKIIFREEENKSDAGGSSKTEPIIPNSAGMGGGGGGGCVCEGRGRRGGGW